MNVFEFARIVELNRAMRSERQNLEVHQREIMTIHDIIAEHLARFADPQARLDEVNALRSTIHQLSPMRHHPVDFVEWVKADDVEANDYNPNSVAPPEMELLHVSIAADGYTQPIVANTEDGHRVVIDGFHRNRVGREFEDIRSTLLGRLPVVQIRAEQSDKSNRMAATIRHNRARGKHSVVKMTDIVLELKRRNWSDSKISKQLGMDADEVLRLSQIGGLAEAFADRDFSAAWDVDELEGGDDVSLD